MNQILEGTTKVDDTPNGLEQGYVHVEFSQAPNIEKDLPNDDTRSAPPQSPPSTILAFGTSVNTSNMGTRGNTTIESHHTRATNLPGVFNKTMGNKRHRLSGDMAFAFKKLTESSKKIKTLKFELQRDAIETTKSIAQSMIALEEWSRKKSRKQILQLAQIFVIKLRTRRLFDVQKI
jgi:hypothetical protein